MRAEFVGVAETYIVHRTSDIDEVVYFLTIQSEHAGEIRFETEDGIVLSPLSEGTLNYVPDNHHGSLKAPVILKPVDNRPYKIIENDHVVILETMRNMMLQVRKFSELLLAALLVGAAGTAFAGTPCGNNLEYELSGTTLILTSPDPTIPATIYSQAFQNRTDFTEVIIPDNVTNIYSHAFNNCTGLTEVVLPPSLTEIGNYAFNGCSNLHWVYCRPQTPPTLDPSGDIFVGCADDLVFCIAKLSYRSAEGWRQYDSIKFQFCHLDEYDEGLVTDDKIEQFREGGRANIDIFRTLRKAGCFNTLTFPFNVPDIASSPLGGDNVEVYTFSSATVESGTLVLEIEKVTNNSMTAGVPYLIQWNNTGEVLNHMTFTGITWDSDQTADDAGTGEVTFHGFYGRTHITDAADGEQHLNLFLQGGNQLYWPIEDDATSMLGFRAWFQITPSGLSSAPVYHGMPALLRIKSTATDICHVQQDDVRCTKVLRNGQIIIIRNGMTYTINGQIVK